MSIRIPLAQNVQVFGRVLGICHQRQWNRLGRGYIGKRWSQLYWIVDVGAVRYLSAKAIQKTKRMIDWGLEWEGVFGGPFDCGIPCCRDSRYFITLESKHMDTIG